MEESLERTAESEQDAGVVRTTKLSGADQASCCVIREGTLRSTASDFLLKTGVDDDLWDGRSGVDGEDRAIA